MLASFQEFAIRIVYGEFLIQIVDETSISIFFLHIGCWHSQKESLIPQWDTTPFLNTY